MVQKLTKPEHERLNAAVQAAGARTAARLSLLIVPVSDHYRLYPLVFAAVVALVAQGFLAFFEPHLGLRNGFMIEAVLFAAAALITDWLPLRLLLVPRRAKHRQASQLAHHAFAARILAVHDRKPGLLIFVSLGERYVELVADDEVHRRIGQEAWNRIVADFATVAKPGHMADAIAGAVEASAALLQTHFPKAN